MSEQRQTQDPRAGEHDEEALDAGLGAAFGPPVALASGSSVLETLRGHLGMKTRIDLPEPTTGTEGAGEVAAPPTETPGVATSRYERREEIARGGMGLIFRSRDTDLGRDVAMKVLHPRHAQNPAMVQRFIEEAQIAGQLQHPGILQIYELGLQADQRPYFTMKLIKGNTLGKLIAGRADPAQDRRRFLGIFENICQTMAYTHARGVIHRDLKPANVMVGHFGEVQIVDWGLAKLLSADTADERPENQTVIETARSESGTDSLAGAVMGTPAAMPPEQARGEIQQLDERCDVFALGAILCEILTGHPPYEGATALEDAKAGRLQTAWAGIEACDADEELKTLARSCLARERDERPRNAGIVTEGISSYLSSVEERARESELEAARARATAAQERRARRLTLALTASIVAVIVIGAGSFIVVQTERLRRIDADSQRAEAALSEATLLLQQAKETPVSDHRSWAALRAAGLQVAALQQGAELDTATRDRVDAFLDELSLADRDLQVINQIEDLVIKGATHQDLESWVQLEEELRAAFREYGIDLDTLSREEVAARIRQSKLAVQLADGLELWIGAAGHLGDLGAAKYDPDELKAWMKVLLEADPDPFRTAVRRAYAKLGSGDIDLADLRRLADSDAFDSSMPRTLSWLGMTFFAVGEQEEMDDVFRRALTLYPSDFMLNFDYGLCLAWAKRWEEAARYYQAGLAVRPETGGIWRSLGVALRESGRMAEAVNALKQSIRYQPDYAPTHVELGRTLADSGDLDGALDAYHQALERNPDYALAHCYLGRALQAKGRLFQALAALRRGDELGRKNPVWDHPSQQWIRECLDQLQARYPQQPSEQDE